MIKLNLGPLFEARGIEKPYSYLLKKGIPRHTAQRILSGEHTHLHFRHVELLCKAFNCSPNDLLIYIPNKEEQLPENHPLHQLKKESVDFSWLQSTANMPLQELHQLIRKVKEEIDQAPQTER
jgi:DNA-binding Xre family transcriptional regulator